MLKFSQSITEMDRFFGARQARAFFVAPKASHRTSGQDKELRLNELQQILRAYSRLQAEGVSAALATVVRVSGSTYRRPGARMLISEDGQVTGSISGGCLERDVCRQAKYVLQTGQAAIAIYDSTDDEDPREGFAMGCNGIVEVLIEKLMPNDQAMAFLSDSLKRRSVAVMATVIAVEGPLVQAPGSRLLLRPNDEPKAIGISDVGLCEALTDASRFALAAGRSTAVLLEVGGSKVGFVVEFVRPAPSLLICGGGHDAVPLVRFAKELGWNVAVIDRRPGYATRARFTEADVLLSSDAKEVIEQLQPTQQALAVVMNHNYPADLDCLGLLLRSPVGYIGLLGPKRRAERLLADLAPSGVVQDEALLRRLYFPVGLDIGADTPEEVALAVIAEMRAVLAGRGGGFSRNRQGPLHERTDSQALLLSLHRAVEGAIVCDTTYA